MGGLAKNIPTNRIIQARELAKNYKYLNLKTYFCEK